MSFAKHDTFKSVQAYRQGTGRTATMQAAATSDFTYIRWHGLNPRHWYDYLYSEDQLKEWKDKIQTISDSVKTVYGYFNNHPNGQAPTNCRQLLKMFGKKTRDPKSFSVIKGKRRKPGKSLDSFF